MLALLEALSLMVALESTTAADIKYPTARRGEVVDEYHGVKVPDPYRWLEELDSAETRQWVRAEAEIAEKYLQSISARAGLRQRLTELQDFEKYGLPMRRHDKYFYRYNKGLDPQSTLFVSKGLNDKGTVLLDPATLSADGSAALLNYDVSSDAKTLIYGVSPSGSDWTDWHIRDIETGKESAELIRWTKYYAPVFGRDNRGIFYSSFPAPKPGEELSARDLGNAIYYHAFGTATSEDQKIFERKEHPDWQYEPHLTPASDWLVLTCGEGQVGDKNLMNVYAINVRSEKHEVVPLVENFDAAYIYIGADRGLLYFQTTLGAPKGRVVAIDPTKPERGQWKHVIHEQPGAMDFNSGSVSLVNHQLLLRTLHDVRSEVQVFDLNGKLRRKLNLPGAGTAFGFDGTPDRRETFFVYTDLITPATVFRLDLQSSGRSVYREPKVRFDPMAYESKQVFYKSKDGTRVPMFIVHKKGLKSDGNNPTLLYGYGGFAISILPTFQPARIAWLERGGVFAIANIRGGGEYGEEWHRQGTRERKQNVFDDFIAAAEWLIAQGYTSTPKLAIEGGSNGGLLVGACLTQRPDLFGATLAYVGVMDMLRFDQFGQGAGWSGDYGSPRDREAFKALSAYSPYHNVRAGTRYPATMIITGDHDTRVMPAHSFKFAAALQAAQAGPAPILLRVHLSAGHGGGVTTQQRIDETADAYAFLFRNLGME